MGDICYVTFIDLKYIETTIISKMLRIIALSCLIAFAQAETRAQHNFNQVQQPTSDQSQDFAQERQIV